MDLKKSDKTGSGIVRRSAVHAYIVWLQFMQFKEAETINIILRRLPLF